MIKELVPMLAEKRGTKYSADNFSQRLRRATITCEEILDIAEIPGFYQKN